MDDWHLAPLGADGAVTSDVEVSGSKADLHSYLLKEKQIVGWPKPYLDVLLEVRIKGDRISGL